MTWAATTPAYQQLAPCVDAKGHAFHVSTPTPGQFGHAFAYCQRCGGSRSELLYKGVTK